MSKEMLTISNVIIGAKYHFYPHYYFIALGIVNNHTIKIQKLDKGLSVKTTFLLPCQAQLDKRYEFVRKLKEWLNE